MVLFPEAQKRIQAELDAVVGRKRLPTFEDRASLPYLEATIKESLRFHPPTPLGIAHRLVEDDVVQGESSTLPRVSSVFFVADGRRVLTTKNNNNKQATASRRAPSCSRTSGR
jgi:cytochrome P450